MLFVQPFLEALENVLFDWFQCIVPTGFFIWQTPVVTVPLYVYLFMQHSQNSNTTFGIRIGSDDLMFIVY